MEQIKTVYVIGAGFSAGCGYPLTSTLLGDLWPRLEDAHQKELEKIIRFHHPSFDKNKKTTFPNIEELLTEMDVNKDMFDMSRPGSGKFTVEKLQKLRAELLIEIEKWFHALYGEAEKTHWLQEFKNRVVTEKAAIISFNWDLLLDHLLFDEINSKNYGLGSGSCIAPVLLKPHGSLNWFPTTKLKPVAAKKKIVIFTNGDKDVSAFTSPRRIKSKSNQHKYAPIIVPPTYLKDFTHPIFIDLWKNCTDVLSNANKIVFLGYSMPISDIQAKFILRCGFHNQIEGAPTKGKSRKKPASAPAEVIIVNPDLTAAQRMEAIAGRQVPCTWVSKSVEDWLTK